MYKMRAFLSALNALCFLEDLEELTNLRCCKLILFHITNGPKPQTY